MKGFCLPGLLCERRFFHDKDEIFIIHTLHTTIDIDTTAMIFVIANNFLIIPVAMYLAYNI